MICQLLTSQKGKKEKELMAFWDEKKEREGGGFWPGEEKKGDGD